MDKKILATPQHPVVAPSGKYKLEIIKQVVDGVESCSFNIIDMKQEGSGTATDFRSQDFFRTRDRLYFIWDKDDRVWVYSSDLGAFYWTKHTDGAWEKHSWVVDKIDVPESLKQFVPSLKA